MLATIAAGDLPLAERRFAFSALAGARKDAKQSAHSEELTTYISDLFSITRQEEHPDRLPAVAELIRVRQTFKVRAKEVDARLGASLRNPLPELSGLPDAKDREYVVMALATASEPWIGDYCAHAAVKEEAAERVREELLVLLLGRSGLDDGMKQLAASAGQLDLDADNAADSAARRASRILAAVMSATYRLEIRPTGDFPSAVCALLRGIFERTGMPGSGDPRHQLLTQVVRTVGWCTRGRASMAVSPETYEPLRLIRGSYGSIGWDSRAKAAITPVAEDLEDAITLQGRQGIPSGGLVDVYRMVIGNPALARQSLVRLADENPTLPERIRHWLRRGELRDEAAVSSFADSALAMLDVRIAEAMIVLAGDQVAHGSRAIREYLEQYASSGHEGIEAIRATLERWYEIDAVVREMASLRNLGLRGKEGAIAPYDPKYFELGSSGASQAMVIQQPAVVRRTEDGVDGECVRRTTAGC